VRLSLDLKNLGKKIYKENPEEYSELCTYDGVVEEQIYWTYRNNFVLIIKNLLDNTFNFDEFESAFSILFKEIGKEVDMLISDLEYIDKFEPSKRSYRFAVAMGAIYRQFEEIEDEYCTEQEVKDYVKEIYLELQELEE